MWRSAMVSLPFLLCALFFPRFGAAQQDFSSEDAATLLKKASENIKIRHYTNALEELNAAIVSDPTLSEAYMHRAFAYRQLCRKMFKDTRLPKTPIKGFIFPARISKPTPTQTSSSLSDPHSTFPENVAPVSKDSKQSVPTLYTCTHIT